MKKTLLITAMTLAGFSAQGQSIPYTFVPNTPAKAAEVNANFAALLAEIQALKARVAELESQSIENLSDFVEVTTDAKGYDLIRFTGVNIQLRNSASSSTTSVNGLGNFIIGKNLANSAKFCSNGNINIEHNTTISEQANCELLPYNHDGNPTSAGIWGNNQRSGSHNLIIGNRHDYSANGALITGEANIANADGTSILGGN